MVVGGYALALHGHPRYTKDIDIWINPQKDNAKKILRVLDEFGFSDLELYDNDFLVSGNVIQLGYPPKRIDLLTQATGINFNECYEKRIKVDIDNVSINFLDIENLKKNKQAVGRLQDLADIEKLS